MSGLKRARVPEGKAKAQEREERAFPKGRERARGIATVVKRRLEVTMVREREGGKEWSKSASEGPPSPWPKPGERECH